jgi:hypothetical protein
LLVSYTASQAVSIVQSNHGHSVASRLGRLFFHFEISLFDSVSSWEFTKSLIQQDPDLKYITRERSIQFSKAMAVEFVTTLQQREDAATPSGMNNHSVDRSLCPSDDKNNYVDLATS